MTAAAGEGHGRGLLALDVSKSKGSTLTIFCTVLRSPEMRLSFDYQKTMKMLHPSYDCHALNDLSLLNNLVITNKNPHIHIHIGWFRLETRSRRKFQSGRARLFRGG